MAVVATTVPYTLWRQRRRARGARLQKTKRYAAELARLGVDVRKLRRQRRWTLERAAERAWLDLKHLKKPKRAG